MGRRNFLNKFNPPLEADRVPSHDRELTGESSEEKKNHDTENDVRMRRICSFFCLDFFSSEDRLFSQRKYF